MLELPIGHVFGAARVTASAVQHMQDGGAIMNVSSISCRLKDQGDLALCGATKAALESLTRNNAHQLGLRGIRVNAIAPGIIDVAIACVFLLSDDASFITGTELIVDGGLMARP